MEYAHYIVIAVHSKTREKHIFNIDIREDSKWNTLSKALDGFFKEYSNYDNENYRIAIYKTEQ